MPYSLPSPATVDPTQITHWRVYRITIISPPGSIPKIHLSVQGGVMVDGGFVPVGKVQEKEVSAASVQAHLGDACLVPGSLFGSIKAGAYAIAVEDGILPSGGSVE